MKKRIYSLLLAALLLALIPFMAPAAQAEDTFVLEYELNSDGTGYIVVGAGCANDAHVVIPDTYNGKPVVGIGQGAFFHEPMSSVVIPGSVKYIGFEAFLLCQRLTTVTAERGLSHIFSRAFAECTRLRTLTIPDTVTDMEDDSFENAPVTTLIVADGSEEVPYAFSYKLRNTLKQVVIPDSVKIINDSAFSQCHNLTSVTMGKGITYVFDYAFYDCPKLEEVHISDLTAWCKIAFTKGFSLPAYYANPLHNGAGLYLNGEEVTDLVIPSGITSLPYGTFLGCTSLRSVTIPDSVTKMNGQVFANCINLTDVTLSNRLTSIPAGTFSGCTSLTAVTIPDSATGITANAFSGCTSLTRITIPNSVTSIGEEAFSGCPNLDELTMSSGITEIGNDAFANVSLGKLTFAEGTKSISLQTVVGNPREVSIPASVTSIGKDAFKRCTRLENVYINDPSAWCKVDFASEKSNPMKFAYRLYVTDANGREQTELVIDDSVTEIPDERFKNCKKPIRLVIGNNVKRIGKSAFEGCSNLAEIVLPKKLDHIKDSAFFACDSIKTVYFKGTSAEWELVIIDGLNSWLERATVICNYTDPAECTHSYNGWWSFDGNGHFQGCILCGQYSNIAAHIPDGEPTEQKAQFCIVCGYVMQFPLIHIHEFADTWNCDKIGHWHSCSGCGEQVDYGTHIDGPHSDANGNNTCIICAYVTGHQHYYRDVLSMDETGHWYPCYWCEERTDFEPHTPGPVATADTDQICTVCGSILVPAVETAPLPTETIAPSVEPTMPSVEPTTPSVEPTTPSVEPTTPPTSAVPEPEASTEPSVGATVPGESEPPKENDFPWPVVFIAAAAGINIGVAVMFVVLKIKKQ